MKTKHQPMSAAAAKGGNHVRNNTIHRKWFALALGGLLFTSIFALSAPPVEAQCQQWDVGHKWRFKQGSTPVDLDLHQNGTVVTGKAVHIADENKVGGGFGALGWVHGDVDGTVKGDHFAVIIHWGNNTTGVYNGTIGPSGRIEGTGYNQASPSVKVNWHSETHMECADAAPVKPKPDATKSTSAAADDWINQELRKRKTNNTYDANDPNRKGHGFINGLSNPTPTPTPSVEADESSSNDTDDQHKKNKKKNKKKHHHHHEDDDENQDNN
jgi:hypothetical protein